MAQLSLRFGPDPVISFDRAAVASRKLLCTGVIFGMKFGTFIKFSLFLGAVFVILAGLVWYFGEYTVTRSEIKYIVLVSIDTCRADHLGCYGYWRNTSPNIDAVAADGVRFNHAVTPVPITLPSHSSMLTGTIPPYHKVRDNSSYRLASANVTLAEILRENGFSTGAVVGAFVLDSQFGLDQGFETYNDNLELNENKYIFSFNERKAEEVSRLANLWLEEHQDENFFLFLHYFDPHVRYELHTSFPFTSRPGLASKIDRYDSEIAYTDHCIGTVINKLKELNLYDSTLLIITSDHGESLGEHSENTHGYFIYHSTLRVPLIIKAPSGPMGRKTDNVAGLIDILPTVCGSVGIPVSAHVQGKDLNSFFRDGKDSVDERFFFCESLMPTKFELGPFFGLVSNRWKYIHTSQSELYNLRKDPHETKNLLRQHPQQARIMENRLKVVLQNNGLTGTGDTKVKLDEESVRRLESLGYISSRPVKESIRLDRGNLDPKEFIEVYNFIEKFLKLTSSKKYEEAKKLANEILAKRPDMKQAHYYLGIVGVMEEKRQAIKAHFTRYLELAQSESDSSGIRAKSEYELSQAHNHLGDVFKHDGQIAPAIAHYKEALSHNPYTATTYHNLAGVYLLQGDLSDAVACYTKILDFDGDATDALNNLAWVLATTENHNIRNPSDAFKFALRACELTKYDNPNYLDSLGAAYAALGRFPEAVETAEKAIGLAKSANQPQLAEEITKHHEFYKRSQPYFDPALAVHIEESSSHSE